jgi:hypothetical protein
MGSSDSENQWYWSKRNSDERKGPVGRERLEELAEEETLEPEDFVWRKGFDDWKEAGSAEEVEELFAGPPPLPDDSSDENDEEETPPPIPEDEKSESPEEYDSPVEFEVKWRGFIWGNEATLRIHENEISLHMNDSDEYGGSVGYGFFKIKELEARKITVRAPLGLSEDLFEKVHHIKFESIEERDVFLRLFKQKKDVKNIEGEDRYAEKGKINTSRNKKVPNSQRTGGSEGSEEESPGGDSSQRIGPTKPEGEEYFWRKYPVGTGVVALIVLVTIIPVGSSDSSSDLVNKTEVDSVSGRTAYMSYNLRSDPQDLSGWRLSGWKTNFNDALGKDVYNAVNKIEEDSIVSAEKIRVLLTMDECRNLKTGNVSTRVPSGSLVIEGFEGILQSSDSEAFTQSITWRSEWVPEFLNRNGLEEFDECSGSFE